MTQPYEKRRLEKMFRQAIVDWLLAAFADGQLMDEQTGDIQANTAFTYLQHRVKLSDDVLVELIGRAQNEWYSR